MALGPAKGQLATAAAATRAAPHRAVGGGRQLKLLNQLRQQPQQWPLSPPIELRPATKQRQAHGQQSATAATVTATSGKLLVHNHQNQKHTTDNCADCRCCCCCCSSSASNNSKPASSTKRLPKHSNDSSPKPIKQQQQQQDSHRMKLLKTATGSGRASDRTQRQQQQQQRQKTTTSVERECCVKENDSNDQRLGAAVADCAKCQLIVRWTSAQAKLAAAAAAAGATSKKQPAASESRPAAIHSSQAEPAGINETTISSKQRVVGVVEQDEEDLAEISSLTDSSLGGVGGLDDADDDDDFDGHANDEDDDKWSFSSAHEANRRRRHYEARQQRPLMMRADGGDTVRTQRQPHQQKPVSRALAATTDRHSQLYQLSPSSGQPPWLAATAGAAAPSCSLGAAAGVRKRRPAPQPPSSVEAGGRRRDAAAVGVQRLRASALACDAGSADSGNTSGGDETASRNSADGHQNWSSQAADLQQQQRHKPTRPPVQQAINNKKPATATTTTTAAPPKLLTESEVYSIEHCLRSHKSSTYVCGCMANLYLTSTELVDNGRCSKPASEGWQLSRTGVPVLTFDSGLTRNRDRRRLSINLTERGSGFVLWSDIIDHLSNYRAFSVQLHGNGDAKTTTSTTNTSGRLERDGNRNDNHHREHDHDADGATDESCDTFHVMYLSTNHRIMVGLSFDDPTCARLFLKQVELVTSDPTNISLTGPKLARRLASVGRLGRLLSGSGGGGGANAAAASHKRAKSIAHLATECDKGGSAAAVDGSNRRIWASSNCVGLAEQQPQHSTPNWDLPHESSSNKTTAASRRGSKFTRLSSAASGTTAGNHDYTWSTLKRAIKFGHRQLQQSAGQQRPAGNGSGNCSSAAAAASVVPAAFRPKPLASLAMAGKVYRAGKKMPRKCDISAPCLFQHVTRVDLSGLDQLYSRSLVGATTANGGADCGQPIAETSAVIATYTSTTASGDEHHDTHDQYHPRTVPPDEPGASSRACARLAAGGRPLGQNRQVAPPHHQPTRGAGERRLSVISAASSSQVVVAPPPLIVAATTAAVASSSSCSASSSCYSSASISSASSEYGGAQPANQHHRHHQSEHTTTTGNGAGQRHCSHSAACRPAPPRRTTSSSGGGSLASSAAASSVAAAELPPQTQPLNHSTGGGQTNKIQAIIKELEAQTSAELVDAKRKLMADIADQVLARAAQCSQGNGGKSAARRAPNGTGVGGKGGGGGGAISRL